MKVDQLIAQLRAADRSMSRERLPPRDVHRIARRLSAELGAQRSRHRGWFPMATFVAGAVLVMVFLAWIGRPEPEGEQVRRPVIAEIHGEDCRHDGRGRVEVRGACSIVGGATPMRIETTPETHLSVEARAVTMHGGKASFDVDPVQGEPLEVSTPGGTIVVVGTRFEVTVTESEARVQLHEGKLAVYPIDGEPLTMVAGEQQTLPVPVPRVAMREPAIRGPEPAGRATVPTAEAMPLGDLGADASEGETAETPVAPNREAGDPRAEATTPTTHARREHASETPEPDDAAAPKALTAHERAAALVDELRALRRAGKLDEAARRLTEALQQDWPPRTAEVLSYELGTLLARHLHASDRACKHWDEHLGRFPDTRYATQIERSRATLSCG